MNHVTVDVCTKNRYLSTLPLTLMSVLSQTRTPDALIIYDDSENVVDMRTLPTYQYIFKMLDEKKIEWRVLFGKKLGQHYGHQMIQEGAKDLIWRIDDDEIAEPNVLKELENTINSDKRVGAVGGLVLMPGAGELPKDADNKISNLNLPNIQWYKWNGKKSVEHIYSSFLYRKGLVDYELALSKVAHREETLFTHSIFKKGFKLWITTNAVTWHFRNPEGGIREGNNPSLWEHDEKIFRERLNEWGVIGESTKICYLDNGLGDHIVFKKLLPEIKKKYKNVIIACCFPEVFEGEQIISIADGKLLIADPERYNIYGYAFNRNIKGTIEELYRRVYEI